MKQRTALKLLFWLLITTNSFAQPVEIPDPNLEKVIREELQLSDNVPITQQEMLRLTWLPTHDKGIIDLIGLEHATNLQSLDLGGNQITDIRPLANLIQLTWLSLWHNHVADITPLANLTKLKTLDLSYNYSIESLEPLKDLIQLEVLNFTNNQVKDITPLANMTKLKYLEFRYNQVSDLTPLANLVNLEELYIKDNLVNDITPLQGLNLVKLSYDEPRDIATPVTWRIQNRTFPSVFQAWDHVEGQDHLTRNQRYALHDLFFSPFFSLWWKPDRGQPQTPGYGQSTSLSGNPDKGYQSRQQLLSLNPNMIFLREVRLHNHGVTDAFLLDSPFWLRDNQGNIIQNANGEYLINFLKSEVQDLLAKRMIAVEQSGLYDGVMLDGFFLNATGFNGKNFYPVTDEDIIQAHLNILKAVRSQVPDDFLILVNANRTKATRYAEYVNGTFMETSKDYPGGYTREGLQEIESTLSWSEKNFRSPRINCLEGQGMSIEPPDGTNNRRWMRVFTTMSLTLSNGYVLYNINRNMSGDPHHWHLWYPFWDADLGRPVGPKAQSYQNIDGLFIREFTNGWAVYNRSGKTRSITLPRGSIGVSSNKQDITHLLPDLDGEIYLRVGKPFDLNRDGTVNVLDLIIVSQAFGSPDGDINGDGTSNVLDLVLVSQQFSQ